MQGTPYDFFVQWHLTERCNLRCKHCYQHRVAGEMSGEEIYQAIDNIKDTIAGWATEYGMEMSPSLHFTGGEPILRSDLLAIMDYARQSGFSTSLMSNGTLITSDVAQRLQETGVHDVQVSLEGLEPIHDTIRGSGSFQQAICGIRNLTSHGLSTNINLTLSRLNMGEINGLISLAKELGVSAVTYSRLVICGRGQQLAGEMLTPRELAALYKKWRMLESNGKVAVISGDPLATVATIGTDVPDTEFPVGGCAAGVFGVTIASDGTIMPCRRMNLAIGNIKEDPLRQVWAESPVLWSLRRRQDYNDRCRSCLYWAVCRGCRAIALACARANGEDDYLAADPQCTYYRPRK